MTSESIWHSQRIDEPIFSKSCVVSLHMTLFSALPTAPSWLLCHTAAWALVLFCIIQLKLHPVAEGKAHTLDDCQSILLVLRSAISRHTKSQRLKTEERTKSNPVKRTWIEELRSFRCSKAFGRLRGGFAVASASFSTDCAAHAAKKCWNIGLKQKNAYHFRGYTSALLLCEAMSFVFASCVWVCSVNNIFAAAVLFFGPKCLSKSKEKEKKMVLQL